MAEVKLALLNYPHLELLRDKPHGISFLVTLEEHRCEQSKVDIYN